MHKSRLVGLVIDSNVTDVETAARFWSAATGRAAKPSSPEDPNYRELETKGDELLLLVQKVSHPSRVHLDIETDDIEAEVRRLERLGAKRIQKVNTWWVMEAPTGHRFCVVRPQRGSLERDANTWNDEG
jgi:hypothetical protein